MSEWILAFAVCVGGALGALLRATCYRIVSQRSVGTRDGASLPLGLPGVTLAVNGLGSFLLGLALVFFEAGAFSEPVRIFWMTGLCGSLSTFSTLCADAIRLRQERQPQHWLGYLAAHAVLGLAALSIGWAVGPALVSRFA